MFDDQQPTPLPKPTLAQLRTVHQTCERFETAWRLDQSLTIEQLLAETSKELRPYLLEALVRSEVELLESSGQRFERSAYLTRFANDSGIIARAFLSPDELEKLDSGVDATGNAPVDSYATPLSQASRSSDQHTPFRLGHFEIRDEIARGGMGIVYRGWDQDLNREVAIKCIRSSMFIDESHVQRFRREAQTVALLKHDSIVPIYEVGCEAGQYYFVMPLIDGENLATKVARTPTDHRELARIVYDSAVATQFAHNQGVIHRDLKPSNILVDRNGKVWVADFGLAKSLQPFDTLPASPTEQTGEDRPLSRTSADGISHTGMIVGTPSYMAPEQTRGYADQLTDVYGLGAILYTGLTGRPPHRAATVLETFHQVNESPPVSPRTLDPQVPRDLETIALKALSKSPAQRYSTAQELADDLQRFLHGHPIHAKPATIAEHMWHWVKREPIVASLTFGVMTALAVGLGISLWFYSLALQNERTATANADLAMDSVREYLTQVADSPELSDQGLEVLRRQLLTSALQYYERLASQAPTSLRLQERLAETHERLGIIHAALGAPDRADDEFQRMFNAYHDLLSQYPTQLDYRRATIEARVQRAQVLTDEGKVDDAVRLIDEAIADSKELVASPRGTLTDRVSLASLSASKGESLNVLGRGDEAKKQLEEASRLCEELVLSAEVGLPSRIAKRLILAFDRISSQLQNAGDFAASEKWCKLGIQICSSPMYATSGDPELRFLQSRLHKNLHLLYSQTRRMDQATPEFEVANEILTKLLQEHPLVFKYLDTKATLIANASGMLVLQGNYDDAKKLIEEAIRLQEQLVARQPSVSEHWNALSNMLGTLGVISRNTLRLDDADAAFQRGILASDKAFELSPDETGVQFFGLNLKNSLAETKISQKRLSEAADLLRPLTQQVLQLVEKNKEAYPVQLLAAASHRSLATCERKLQNTAAATRAANKAIEIFDQLPPPIVKTGLTPRILSDALFTRAHASFLQSKLADATADIDRALSVLTPLVDAPQTAPANAMVLRTSRGDVLDLQAQIASAQQDYATAIELYRQAINDQLSVMEQAKDQPATLQLIRELHVPVQIRLARSLQHEKKWTEALQACNKAIELNTSDSPEAVRLKQEIEKEAPENPNA